MRLAQLAAQAGLAIPKDADADVRVTGFAIDHRKVAPGTVFGAFRGAVANGEDYIDAAIAAGAIAIVAHDDARVSGAAHFSDPQPRRAFAQLAAQFFTPVPATVLAVTGTNGKTSTVEMVRQLWRMAGHHAASIGTLGVTTSDESVSTGLTSPDIVTFFGNMGGLAREGVTHVAYEASSHGLAQYRNEGLRVAAAGFTNFSRDHLDYHANMEDYFAAKMRLFDDVLDGNGTAVVWSSRPFSEDGASEDDWARRTIGHARKRNLRVLKVGVWGDAAEAGDASGIHLVAHTPTRLGQTLALRYQDTEYSIALPLIGAYQAANALVAAGLVLATGGTPAATFDAMARLQPVHGRLERAAILACGAPVYVDYAHTPDALEAAIAALSPHVAGRLIVVFGAGGDRDHGKRGAMGAIAADHADLAIVTDDNPRSEDPAAIRAAILAGGNGEALQEIGDRRAAIDHAIATAQADDIVLVAGKGHEEGQIIGSGDTMQTLPFNDVEVVREVAARHGADT